MSKTNTLIERNSVKVTGGFGNQLFQYFFARSLSFSLKKNYFLDCSDYTHVYKLHKLNLKQLKLKLLIDYSNKESKILKYIYFILKKNYVEKSFCFFDKQLLFKKNIKNYFGYWQSYKYFEKNWKIFKNDINLKKINPKKKKNLELIKEKNSISVHIRRADYIKNEKAKKFHGSPNLDYYFKSIRFFEKKTFAPTFFFFSDDINWVKKKFSSLRKNNFFYIENFRNELQFPMDDLILMSSCKHNIIANSTFSWWGAWLNNYKKKIVIAPKNWTVDIKSANTDLIPKNWKIF